jgi:hypothetical protein
LRPGHHQRPVLTGPVAAQQHRAVLVDLVQQERVTAVVVVVVLPLPFLLKREGLGTRTAVPSNGSGLIQQSASQTAQLAGFSPTGSRPPSSGGPSSVPFAISATKVRYGSGKTTPCLRSHTQSASQPKGQCRTSSGKASRRRAIAPEIASSTHYRYHRSPTL